MLEMLSQKAKQANEAMVTADACFITLNLRGENMLI